MAGFISALTDSQTGITLDTFWTALTSVVPLLVVVFTVAVSYYVIRRVLKKASRLKAGI